MLQLLPSLSLTHEPLNRIESEGFHLVIVALKGELERHEVLVGIRVLTV